MATVPSYFTDFLSKIRLTDSQTQDCKTGHTNLRKRLRADKDLAPIFVESFLQGSYRRSTAVRPSEDSKKSDVDVIVVTTLDRNKFPPLAALELFRPFLEKHYKGKYKLQGRAWGIELSYVELDLVPTSAPSEAIKKLVKSSTVAMDESIEEVKNWNYGFISASDGIEVSEATKKEWQKDPLWIPDRDAGNWDETHPLAQIATTVIKNKGCNGHFVKVVKCLKWWRLTKKPKPKHPKSYPLEHLLCLNCPDGIDSVAEGIVRSLESIRDRYQPYALIKKTPFVQDHGVPHHNVLGRVSGEDFAGFHKIIQEAATQARLAYDEEDVRKSAVLWREIFGDKFPEPPEEKEGGGEPPKSGYTPRSEKSIIGGGRFA